MKKRVKRDFIQDTSSGRSPRSRNDRRPSRKAVAIRSEVYNLNDPRWTQMWYLVCTPFYSLSISNNLTFKWIRRNRTMKSVDCADSQFQKGNAPKGKSILLSRLHREFPENRFLIYENYHTPDRFVGASNCFVWNRWPCLWYCPPRLERATPHSIHNVISDFYRESSRVRGAIKFRGRQQYHQS